MQLFTCTSKGPSLFIDDFERVSIGTCATYCSKSPEKTLD